MAKKLHGNNALVFGNKSASGRTLSKIDRVTMNRKSRTIKISRTPIYSVKGKRKIMATQTNFSKRAAHESGLRIERYYIEAAERQIRKYMK